MMRKLLSALVVLVLSWTSPVLAQVMQVPGASPGLTLGAPRASENASVDCRSMSHSACEAAVRAVAQGRYRGPVAPTTEPMACVRVVVQRPQDGQHLTEVVWTKGTALVNGGTFLQDNMVIARQRPGAANIRNYPGRTDLVVVESCIPRRWLSGIQHLTLCNGTKVDEGFHWQVASESLELLRGPQGHHGTFVPLIPSSVRRTISSSQAAVDYVRYMRGSRQ